MYQFSTESHSLQTKKTVRIGMNISVNNLIRVCLRRLLCFITDTKIKAAKTRVASVHLIYLPLQWPILQLRDETHNIGGNGTWLPATPWINSSSLGHFNCTANYLLESDN